LYTFEYIDDKMFVRRFTFACLVIFCSCGSSVPGKFIARHVSHCPDRLEGWPTDDSEAILLMNESKSEWLEFTVKKQTIGSLGQVVYNDVFIVLKPGQEKCVGLSKTRIFSGEVLTNKFELAGARPYSPRR